MNDDLASALTAVLRQPGSATLVNLHEALLLCDATADRDAALTTATRFHDYLLDLEGKLTARQFSELSSWMDVAAMGVVAFENVLSGQATDLPSLLVGLLAEGIMVVGSRQHIKAWEVDARQQHDRAAWYLREAFWRLSEQRQPDLAADQRLLRLRALVAPAGQETVSGRRMAVIGQLFQILLLVQVSRLLPAR